MTGFHIKNFSKKEKSSQILSVHNRLNASFPALKEVQNSAEHEL